MAEPINYAGALRRSWRLFVALAVVGAVIAVLLPVSKPKPSTTGRLHWETSAVVGSVSATGIGNPPVGPQAILFWADNFYIKAKAIGVAGLSSSYSELAPLMSATTTDLGKSTKRTATSTAKSSGKLSPESVVQLTTYGMSRTESARLTNSYATQVGDAVNKAYATHQQESATKSGQTTAPTSSGFTVLEPALASQATHVVPAVSQLNSRKVRGLIGILVGLVLAALIVLVRELVDKTVRDPAGAERCFRYPVLVSIPERPTLAVGDQASLPLDVVTDPVSAAAEAYRMLRMSVMFEALAPSRPANDGVGDMGTWLMPAPEVYRSPEPESRKVVLVVSAGAEESRSVVAANLSAAYAESGQRAIVVSTGDIDSGPRVRGLIEPSVPAGPADIAAHLQASSVERVSRLSLRPFVMNSGQLVTRAPDVFGAARQLADVVIVEAPPLLAVHHGEALAHAVDVVLLVGECGTTTYDGARQASDLLRRLGAPVLGVVLTDVKQSKRQRKQLLAAQGSLPAPVTAPSADVTARVVPEATQA